ncbi:MAG: hypothetical protein A3205_05450 [Methanomassiliicoccales archaeon Mx-03]|nr:MAG: hypothetical protein A3205_05450 [Methanomassiliicoccales archaeon Mx-03]
MMMALTMVTYLTAEAKTVETPYDGDRFYTVAGERDGVPFEEECVCRNVSEGTYRIYEFTTGSDVPAFDIMFDLDDNPLYPCVYNGDGTWRYTQDGVEYTLVIGDYCTVESFEAVDGDLRFEGTLTHTEAVS